MIDYQSLLRRAPSGDQQATIDFLKEELPYEWHDEYLEMTPRPTSIYRFTHDGFEFLFDNYSALGTPSGVAASQTVEDRLVAVHGTSRPRTMTRETSRIRGWIGPTGRFLGGDRDKGHFIGCALGGRMDGLEINMFAQLRAVNRGWSLAGRRFRSMERYCVAHPGTYCFNRPLYDDESSRPTAFEFGILTLERCLWVERFAN